MTNAEIVELRTLACAATPGEWRAQPWQSSERGVGIIATHLDVPAGNTPTRGIVAWVCQWFRPKEWAVADAAYIAAANPATTLALLDRLANAEKVLRVFAEAAEDLDDIDNGEIWEKPVAMGIACFDLRAARAHFARYKETGDVP